MAENLIDAILAGRVEDPDGGPNLSVPTKSIVIEQSLDGREADLIAELGFGSRLAVVSDLNTRDALGKRVEGALSSMARVERVVLPGTPHADIETVALLEKETAQADALIAVGSGTINDLCKLTSARAEKPYAVFAAAPSMNGCQPPRTLGWNEFAQRACLWFQSQDARRAGVITLLECGPSTVL